MENKRKANGRMLFAIALFIVIGLLSNLIISYNQSHTLQERRVVGDEVLTIIQTVDSKIDEINNRLKILEENINSNSNITGNQ